MHRSLTLAAALGALLIMNATATTTRAADVVLVDAGEARGSIVIADDASASERWAANELADHLRQMSGAAVAVTTQSEGGVVYLGQAAIDAGLVDGIEALGDEGFAIVTGDGAVGIAGGRLRGTMYGVFTLLHEQGCRWWTPTESDIPRRETITVAATDRRVVPTLEYRDMMYMEMYGEQGQTWAARNRVNGMAWSNAPERLGGRYQFVGNLVHSYNQLLRDSGLEIEPEMWALRDGQRRPDSQPCLTHPKVLEAMTISVLKRFEDNPDAEFVVVGQNDNRSYCQCDDCQAVAEREGSQAGPVIELANAVLADVQAERPGSRIATPAYQWSRRPPRDLQPHEDIIIVLCSIEADFHTPLADGTTERNREFKRDIEGWHEIANKLFIWDYTTNFRHFLAPYPNLDVLAANVRFFAEQGAAGVFEQGAHTGRSSEFFGLRMWVLAQALWDPASSDDATLVDEFVRGYYGPAAEPIADYINLIHRHVRENPDMRMGIYQALDRPWLTAETIAEAEALMRDAADRVAGDAGLEARVRHARLPIWYVLAKRGPGNRTWQTVEQRVGSLSFAEVADGIAQVHAERGFTSLAEGHTVEAWLQWLDDYAGGVADAGPPRPDEASANAVRIIQAGHFDPHFARGHWLVPAQGASDGWAIGSPTNAWFVRHHLLEGEDFDPGQTYRLLARVRGEGVAEHAQGTLAQLGMHGGGEAHTHGLDAELLADGQWHVVEVARWQPRPGAGLWMALTAEANDNDLIEAVQLDAFWLEPVGE